MPPHIHFVEPFFGGGSVLLAIDPMDQRLWKPPIKGRSELVADIDGRLMNFWRVLASSEMFPDFLRTVQAIPLSRASWEEYSELLHSAPEAGPVTRAVAFFVTCRQSLAGRMKSFTPLTRQRTRRGMNGNVSEWLGAVEGLPEVHARLRRVAIENRPAVEVIKREDTRGTLYYCDCPYIKEARTAPDVYSFEMSDDDHRELIDTLLGIKGKAIVSGYHHPIYDALHEKHGWNLEEIEIANHASGSKTKKTMTECLWSSY